MGVDVPGLIGIIVFYIVILVIGIIAGRKTTKTNTSDEIFVANRSIGVWLSYFTISATNIGGGYINGTAESIAFSGLLWTTAPIFYTLSIAFIGIFYAPKMRRAGYVTMFDPFQLKLGKRIGGLFFFPDLLGDVFWTASILSALGSTMSLILELDPTLSIIVSACIAVFYTFFGGLYSVAYTDIIQLIILAIGLLSLMTTCGLQCVACPFPFYHPSVDMSALNGTWVGDIPQGSIGTYIDLCLQLFLGGFAWQVYYQRALACKTTRIITVSSILAAVTSFLIAVPPAAMGVVGSVTDWNATAYDGPIPIPKDRHSFILPMVLKYLCPRPVAVIAIGAVAAAVMSSADSAVLSAGTVFSKNIYKDIFRPQASDRELIWVMRVAILICGALACLIATVVKTVYGLFYLCSDLMYVILFPQLTCVLWVKFTNGYGSLTAYATSLFLRIACGDSLLGIPALIKFPLYSEEEGQGFPVRSFCALVNFTVLISVSWLTHVMFTKGLLSRKRDILNAVHYGDDAAVEKGTNEKLMTDYDSDNVKTTKKEEKETFRESFT